MAYFRFVLFAEADQYKLSYIRSRTSSKPNSTMKKKNWTLSQNPSGIPQLRTLVKIQHMAAVKFIRILHFRKLQKTEGWSRNVFHVSPWVSSRSSRCRRIAASLFLTFKFTSKSSLSLASWLTDDCECICLYYYDCGRSLSDWIGNADWISCATDGSWHLYARIKAASLSWFQISP